MGHTRQSRNEIDPGRPESALTKKMVQVKAELNGTAAGGPIMHAEMAPTAGRGLAFVRLGARPAGVSSRANVREVRGR